MAFEQYLCPIHVLNEKNKYSLSLFLSRIISVFVAKPYKRKEKQLSAL